MKTLNCQQGTPEWHAARAKCFTASEAPAMMGVSKYMTRSDLLKQKATGNSEEVGAAKQALFNRGHDTEAAARPIVEQIIGEPIYPVTGSMDVDGLPLLASFDGITMDESIIFEHKLFNETLAGQVRNNDLPPSYYWQLEQQLLVSGAKKAIFITSDGTEESFESMEYAPVEGRAEALIAGWKQFAIDLANYQHAEVIPAAVAAQQMQLPAVSVQVSGSIALISNLDKFGEALTDYVAKINKKPETDQDFADLEATVKTLKAAEDALEAAESNALAQTSSIDEMRRAVALYRDTARNNRLLVEKLVKAEKENRKNAIVQAGKDAFSQHIGALNARIGKPYMPHVLVDFAAAIRSLKTMTSIQNAVDTALAGGKIEADAIANKITANLLALREHAEKYKFLFADTAQLIGKETDDLIAVIKSRIAEHKAAEEKRLEAEREKIRAEEAAKLKAEADAKAAAEAKTIADQQAAEAKAREQAESAKPVPAVTPAAPVAAPSITAPASLNPSGGWPAPVRAVVPAGMLEERTVPVHIQKLRADIHAALYDFTDAEHQLVLHYCEKLKASRKAAA